MPRAMVAVNNNGFAVEQPSRSTDANQANKALPSECGLLAGVKRRRQQKMEQRCLPNEGSINSSTSFCTRMRKLDISNLKPQVTDSESVQPYRRTGKAMNGGT